MWSVPAERTLDTPREYKVLVNFNNSDLKYAVCFAAFYQIIFNFLLEVFQPLSYRKSKPIVPSRPHQQIFIN